jgi:hypothetical protein
MMQPVLRASPSFEPVWREFLAEWEGQSEGLPMYLVLSELARHIAKLCDRGVDPELREIFRIVEDWHLYGDEYVREAATIGLLEDLQNTNVVAEHIPARCVSYLGPESLRWWRKVENFWEKGELIRND